MSGPSLRDRMRPIELVGIAMVAAAFVGVVVVVGSRQPTLAVVAAGIAFILSLLLLAMLALVAGAPGPSGDQPVLHPRRRPEDPPND